MNRPYLNLNPNAPERFVVLDRDRVHLLWVNFRTLLGRQDGAADTKREEKQQECDACDEAHVILPA